MSGWEIEFEGLDELIKTCESLATENQLENTNKKVLKECGDLAYETVKPLIHKSKDNSKSGRKGSRPNGHALDNIPKPKISKKKGKLQCIVGWEKSDNTPYFYMKMEEWGTSKRPPHHSFGVVNKLLRKQYSNIALKHYEKLVKKLED
ncbi:HK97 gp10 family phage protein [Clostridium perfringens]|uniref:HK97-gp10 family putative phage morphogenesis protein n=1 Tax=Clostridium perfringens TaxID=1502 RepID=UPI0024BC52A5|nr:HK97-gp10 family putative phage morphogenesis protein [Clostridium perfringens]ELQ0171365.1 HK97 gp10 family phage protein [Clostridium perfringens]MDK0564357.1 HK97 gp10 family phage protein [Clostridium perfringens]MDU3845891.1 HK97 gp10 family phage protein [Clostridium perfringens]